MRPRGEETGPWVEDDPEYTTSRYPGHVITIYRCPVHEF